jgi:hypothetical protein
VYCGPMTECELYFRKLESHLPLVPVINSADYILEASARLPLLRDDSGDGDGSGGVERQKICVVDLAERVAEQCDQFLFHQDDTDVTAISTADGLINNLVVLSTAGWIDWVQRNRHLAVVLVRRDFLKEARRPGYWAIHFSRCVALGLFLGINYFMIYFKIYSLLLSSCDLLYKYAYCINGMLLIDNTCCC